jgi:hypothetical protein
MFFANWLRGPRIAHSLVTYSKENKMLRKISLLGVFVLGFCGMTVPARAQLPRTWHDADLTALGGGPRMKGSIASLHDPSSKRKTEKNQKSSVRRFRFGRAEPFSFLQTTPLHTILGSGAPGRPRSCFSTLVPMTLVDPLLTNSFPPACWGNEAGMVNGSALA